MSSSQNTPEMQEIGTIVENVAKSLKGKYDGRGKYKRKKRAIGDPSKPGPKPSWVKHIPRNLASKTLQEFDSIVPPSQIYRELHAQKRFMDLWTMRCDVENRLLGRPFTAVNPAEKPGSPALAQDNRLQLAIGTLNIGGTKDKTKKAKQLRTQAQLAADSRAIRGTLVSDSVHDGSEVPQDVQLIDNIAATQK